ncbi:MAG: EscU/YscU/HrcU family type III secretion system export apparatus switch protein [Mycobacteriales bacterium]|nr:EscU/YscU/HrcU family type III secretion system export apparatus switch protein [Mycobacteriales bacterium]
MSGEKTEKATPKKKQDLRKKGSAARSVDLPSGVSLVALVLVMPMLVGSLTGVVEEHMALLLGRADVESLAQARELTAGLLVDSVKAIALPVALVGAAALASGSLVTRSAPNPHALKPSWDRMSPAKTAKRMVSQHSLVELLRNTVKLALLALVTYGAWQDGYAKLIASGGGLESLRSIVGDATTGMLWRMALLAVVVGLADAAWQRHSFNKQSRMSHQDIQDEHKQQEGNPQAKGAMRSRQLAMARSRMVQAVPRADVVLANPTHLVVALQYVPGSAAPVVVARGAGVVADRIKAIAVEHGVPVLADKPLARALYRATEVGDTIPIELFRAVAEVLAVVYAARRRGTRPTWHPTRTEVAA